MSTEFLPATQSSAGRTSTTAEPATDPARFEADALVVFLSTDGIGQGAAASLDQATSGLLHQLIKQGDLTGKPCECVSLFAPMGLACQQLLVVGVGATAELNAGLLYRAAATAARQLASRPRQRIGFLAEGSWTNEQLEQAVAGGAVGMVGQDLYRAEKRQHPFSATVWLGAPVEVVRRGKLIADGVNLARRLVNLPPDDLYPETFAEEAATIAGRVGLEIEIWDQPRLERERCRALLAVARGSARPPRLVLLHYRGSGHSDTRPDLALVGKGVTFDSGGLSLKPSEGMVAMKCDMAGAATVLGAMSAIAELGLKVNVIGLMGMVENLVSGKAYKLGDVLTARNGKTIEVHNTDAEGRLVLADVLCYAVDREVDYIIDLATLTGACVVALGMDVVGLFSNHEEWSEKVLSAAKTCGEPIWPMPMFDEYNELLKSDLADVKNIGGRWGGAITAAKFLENFVNETAWVHLDIAGPAFAESSKPHQEGGGSGAMVRTLVETALQLK